MSLEQALDALALFELRAGDIPNELRSLWLIEEARESISIAALDVRHRRFLALFGMLKLAYLHTRLWLLLNGIEALEKSTTLMNNQRHP